VENEKIECINESKNLPELLKSSHLQISTLNLELLPDDYLAEISCSNNNRYL